MINHLTLTIENLLNQLQDTIVQLSDQQYIAPIALIGGSTIGEHIRHILEFYISLYNGYESGIINYDDRKRDHNLQNKRLDAISKIKQIQSTINSNNRLMLLEITDENECPQQLETSYTRELLYNLDHTIHHMALLRIGIPQISEITLADNFGVAAATVKYRKVCAQ